MSLNAWKGNRKTAADFAFEGEEAKHTEFLVSLIARGGNFNRNPALPSAAIDQFGDFFEKRPGGSPSEAMRAVASDNKALVVGVLLTIGVDAESADDQGRTPLMLAAKEGHHEVVSALLGDSSANVNVNARDNDNNTALHLAALNNKDLVVSVLLEERDLEVNLKNEDRKTALHLASKKGYHEVVSALVDDEHERLLVNEIDRDGKTALHLASEEGRHEVVSALFRDDSLEVNRKDNDGNAALHLASMDNKASLVVSVLLGETATNVTLTNEAGETALEVALGNSSWAVVSVFYSERPEIVYDKLYEAATEGEVADVSALIEHTSLDVNRQGDNGNAALHLAVLNNEVSVVVTLLAVSTLNVTLTNDDGETALDIAIGNSSWDVVSAFYSERPEIVYNELYEAIRGGEVTVVSPLIEHTSLDVNRKGADGNAALHLAALSNKVSVVVALLGVSTLNVTLTNGEEKTALYIAAEKRYSGVVSAILDDDVNVGYPDLYKAARNGQVTVVSALIGYSGLNVNETDANGNAALHLAALNNKVSVVVALLGVSTLNVTLTNGEGKTALYIAAEKRYSGVVSAILDDDVNVGYPDLYKAARNGQVTVVSALIGYSGLNVNETDANGNAALHLAALNNKVSVVVALLGVSTLNVTLTNGEGKTALYIAAEKRYSGVVSAILDDNVDVGYPDLRKAAGEGKVTVVSALIEHASLDVNRKGADGNAALHLAALNNKVSVVAVLFNVNTLNVTLTNGIGKTALEIALDAENGGVVSAFVSRFPNIVYGTLYEAAENGRVTVVSALIGVDGLDVNRQREADGNAALHLAASNDHAPVVSVLLESDANVNLTNRDGDAALHIAADRDNSGMVSVLIDESNPDVNLKDRDGYAALHIAAEKGYPNVASALFRASNLNDILTTDGGDKPVYLAAKENNPDVVAILVRNRLDAGYVELYRAAANNKPIVVSVLIRDENIDVNRRTRNNDTALHLGARGGHSDVVSVLVEYPGTLWVNSINTDGDTALHIAAKEGFASVVSALVRDGNLDVNLTDRAGKTAVYIAAERRYSDVVSVLTGDDVASGHAALHKAAEIGGAVAVSVLIRDGNLNANHPNRYGNAALHIAAIEDQSGVAAVLVGYDSVNVNLTNSLGNSALHIAADRNRSSVVPVLVEHDRLSVNLVNRAGKTATDIAFPRRREIAISLIVRSNGVFKDHDVFSDSQVIDFLGSGDVNRSVAASVAAAILAAGNLNPAYGDKDTLFEWALSDGSGAVGTLFFKPVIADAAKKATLGFTDDNINDIRDVVNNYLTNDSNDRTDHKNDAFLYAIKQRNLNAVKALHALGADLNYSRVDSRTTRYVRVVTPLVYAIKYARGNHDIFDFILARPEINNANRSFGPFVAEEGYGVLAPIHYAADVWSNYMIDELIRVGPPDYANFMEGTWHRRLTPPLDIVSSRRSHADSYTRGTLPIIENLLRHGANPFLKLEGNRYGYWYPFRVAYHSVGRMTVYLDYLTDDSNPHSLTNPDNPHRNDYRRAIIDNLYTPVRNRHSWFDWRYIHINMEVILNYMADGDLDMDCEFTIPGGALTFKAWTLRQADNEADSSTAERLRTLMGLCPPVEEEVDGLPGAPLSPSLNSARLLPDFDHAAITELHEALDW